MLLRVLSFGARVQRWFSWNRGAGVILAVMLATFVYAGLETAFAEYDVDPILRVVQLFAAIAAAAATIVWVVRGRHRFGPPEPVYVPLPPRIAGSALRPEYRSEPLVQREVVIQREVIERQVIVVRCSHCGDLTPADHGACRHCGAPVP